MTDIKLKHKDQLSFLKEIYSKCHKIPIEKVKDEQSNRKT